jgi:hypothetical protein
MPVSAKGGKCAIRKGRILSQSIKKPSGYRQVTLCSSSGKRVSALVHIVVAQAFLGLRPEGFHVRHLDCDTSNNSVENLAYGSPKENAADTISCGRRPRGQGHHMSKLSDQAAKKILDGKGTVSAKTIASIHGISIAHVYQIQRGKCWRHLHSKGARLKFH